MRIGYFDCFSGISGDMCLGALVSAGWPAAELEALPARLGLEGVTIAVSQARRGPFAATRVDVGVTARQPHRHLRHIAAMIDAAPLDPEVRERAHAVFRRLAEAEAEVHGQSVEKVHFHEVGAADALIDVIGTVLGLRSLGVGRVFSSTPRLGRGSVKTEHGQIPVPAPATTLLLRGAPIEIPAIDAELVTPTGAALLVTLVEQWTPPPPFRLERVGTGAGHRDLSEQANVLRLMVGEPVEAAETRRRVAVLETALDDDNPQFVAALIPRLIEAGALDAMVVPSVMKKGRLGSWLVVIADPVAVDALARLVLTESSTLGVRVRFEERVELERRVTEVVTPFGRVRVKIASLPGGGERVVPEFEAVRELAERTGRSLREISDAATAAWRPGSLGGA